VNTCTLLIARWRQAELDLVLSGHDACIQQEATIEFCAVDAEKIDLAGLIDGSALPRGRQGVAAQVSDHRVTRGAESTGLALNAQDLTGDLKGEIEPGVIAHRPQYWDAQTRGCQGDFKFRDVTGSVRIKHEHMFACDADRKRLGGTSMGTPASKMPTQAE
jgi:hypothetical protein